VWLLRYLRELFAWSFRHYRVHTALWGLLVVALSALGLSRVFTINQRTVGIFLVAWFGILVLVIAPARLWHAFDERLRAQFSFIDHPDSDWLEGSSVQCVGVTLKNTGSTVLTNVEVSLADIRPSAGDFSPGLSLRPRGADMDSLPFVLKPGVHRTIEVISLYINYPYGTIFFVGRKEELAVPLGTYHMLLVASANETVAVERWITVTLTRVANSQTLLLSFANAP
jgi:hypothetical protein